jgi:predicted acetyltransferase
VHQTLFWITDDGGVVVGFLGLRHTLNGFLENIGGHIGYSVRPAARRRGHASAALRLALGESAALGIVKVLLTCDDDNVASARTIESNGGVLQEVVEGTPWGYGPVRRYWISTPV